MEIRSIRDGGKISFYEKLPSRNLVFITFIVTVGSAFHFGYNTVILNVPHDKLETRISNIIKSRGFKELSESEKIIKMVWGFLNTVYFFGGTVGAVIAVPAIDKFDKVKVIFATCGIAIVATFAMAVAFFTKMLISIIIVRFVLGTISGVFSCAIPIYLSEIAPIRTRGMVCSCFSMMQAVGILAAFICGNMEHSGENQWVFVIVLPVVPLILQFIFMGFCRRSPRFLLIKKRDYDAAVKSLQWLRRTDYLFLLEPELDEISKEFEDAVRYSALSIGWAQLLSTKYIRKPLLISMMMMCAQQLTGINLFMLYSTGLLEDVGVSNYHAHVGAIAIGAIFLFMCIISVILVEITGRRTLMLYGYVGTFIFSLLNYLTYMYNEAQHAHQVCVGAVAGLFIWYFMFHYALGPHSVPWILIPEIFNQASRPKAVAVAACCNWLLSSLTASFWPLSEIIGPHLILLHLCCQIIFFPLLYKYVPETRNRTILETTEVYM